VEPFIETSDLVAGAARSLAAVAPSLPTREHLSKEIEDAQLAAERGYFLPDEDERIRFAFARYLACRAALFSTIQDLRPLVTPVAIRVRRPEDEDELKAFTVALCAACMLVRSGWFLVDNYAKSDVVWKKLDEAEPRYGIVRKEFTRIYKSLTRPLHGYQFFQALRVGRDREDEIVALEADPVLAPVIGLLREEREFAVELKRRTFVKGRLHYWKHSMRRRRHSSLQRVTFSLFEMSGRAIAEMRNPFYKKRVTPTIMRRIAKLLQPGDVIVTRHDDAMSNLFLPGFWPHAALYIGSREQRETLGLACDDDPAENVAVLEARKDGVRLRQLEDTLSVDAFVVIRPRLSDSDLKVALERGLSHKGKLYDFEFDFCRSDRLVCTEVVYRSFHGVGAINYELTRRAGRLCLSAEKLLNHAVFREDFELVVIFGTDGRNFDSGSRALGKLKESYVSGGGIF